MVDFGFFTMAVTHAVQVIAILEAMKKFIKSKLPAWVYIVISAFVSLALGSIPERIQLAVFVFCLAELFYDSLWKLVKSKLEGKPRGCDGEGACVH